MAYLGVHILSSILISTAMASSSFWSTITRPITARLQSSYTMSPLIFSPERLPKQRSPVVSRMPFRC
jgi:hypothetical protein